MVLRGEQFRRSGPVRCAFLTTHSLSSNVPWLTQVDQDVRLSVGKRFPSTIRCREYVNCMMVPRGLARDDA